MHSDGSALTLAVAGCQLPSTSLQWPSTQYGCLVSRGCPEAALEAGTGPKGKPLHGHFGDRLFG